MSAGTDARALLPAVDRVLRAMEARPEASSYAPARRADAARAVLARLRAALPAVVPGVEEVAAEALALLAAEAAAGLSRAVNGTGIVLHTGLGRAVLAPEAVAAVAALDGCCTLQIDLETGARGRRDAVIAHLLATLTGCEAATVVNNNAAATLLVLAALCAGRQVVVSRGQLIEIGGSFRLPDVIQASGARMVEVGTTNKTHLRDYERALTPDTAALLHVHPSNYRIIGFSQSVSLAEPASLKEGRELILIDDLGCGALVDLARVGLPHEPTVQESLAGGADVALFSGDKLIGGPQCGIIVGKRTCIEKIRKHPLARALRVGKFTVAALEATLKLFLNPETAWRRVPTLRMLALTVDELVARATALADRLSPLFRARRTHGERLRAARCLPQGFPPPPWRWRIQRCPPASWRAGFASPIPRSWGASITSNIFWTRGPYSPATRSASRPPPEWSGG
ncbi:L-seryl-tRNA(Sec) selenium transferase [bacterium]|nr:L-seryl-tRNA(Sec) selenium transferase [bacterium]